MTDEELAALRAEVVADRERQGKSAQITDPVVIGRVAALVRSALARGGEQLDQTA
jgi:hypothetical protein